MHAAFFFWEKKKKMSTRHAYQWSDGFEVLDVLPRGPMDLKFGCASRRSIEIEFGRASQRSDGLKFECAS